MRRGVCLLTGGVQLECVVWGVCGVLLFFFLKKNTLFRLFWVSQGKWRGSGLLGVLVFFLSVFFVIVGGWWLLLVSLVIVGFGRLSGF